jgi:acyl carrier protein phosphodiesterase
MNFLSHYHVVAPATPYATVGSVLPDLVRMFDREERLHLLQPPSNEGLSPELAAINQGVDWHLQVDQKFHQTNFFEENARYIKQYLQEQSFSQYPRFLYFVAHILLELLLDRLLVKRERPVARQFYSRLEAVERLPVISYLNRQKNVQYPEAFWKKFTQFREKQYVFDYAHNENFIYALNRVIARTGNQGFAEQDFELLAQCIDHFETLFEHSSLQQLFDKLTPYDAVRST